jgi:hypothetical protein
MLLLKIQTASGGVPLDSDETVGGLVYLTAVGVLAGGRGDEIRA